MLLKMMEMFKPKLCRLDEQLREKAPAPPPTAAAEEFQDPEDTLIVDDAEEEDGDTDYSSCVDEEEGGPLISLPERSSNGSGRKPFFAAFLKDKSIIPRSAERDTDDDDNHLDIGWPTDVRHVTHVSVDPTFSCFHHEYKAFWSLPPDETV